MGLFSGKKGMVLGVANDFSIAWAISQKLLAEGAEIGFTHLPGEKMERRVRKLVDPIGARLVTPCDVQKDDDVARVFREAQQTYGALDFVLHSIAFAPKDDLQGGLLNCSAEGFAKAMDISCHSFVRMAKLAAPLMTEGGSMFAMSYYGANRVVPNYNVMGPVKAALEAACRYLAYELGPSGIRVHAISPGPLKTRAASGLKDFELLLNEAAAKSPIGELADIMDVGFACAYLATPFAHRITGGTVYVDGGANIVA